VKDVHLKVVHVEFFDADFVIFTFIKKYKGMTSDLVAISFPKQSISWPWFGFLYTNKNSRTNQLYEIGLATIQRLIDNQNVSVSEFTTPNSPARQNKETK
jgi:hypothetical protein